MKLQYLGDARDAFKWDLLHWICTTSPFSNLLFVPLLTPDRAGSGEGLTSHHRFNCQDFIRPFLDKLKDEPRCLNRISMLGKLDSKKQFQVSVFGPERFILSGAKHSEYWSDFDVSTLENAVVFFDPDNGFETKRQYEKKKQPGPKWIGHDELRELFDRLPQTSVAVVYQHRPFFRKWPALFNELTQNLAYVHTAVVVHESNLAFIGMAGNDEAGHHIASAMKKYADANPSVGFRLFSRGKFPQVLHQAS
jgi:hypothetical protein